MPNTLMPTTTLLDLINEAHKKKITASGIKRPRVITWDIPADIATGRPVCFLAVAVGYEHIQMCYDSLANVLAIYGDLTETIQVRSMVFPVSAHAPGNAPSRIKVLPEFLTNAYKVGKMVTLYFDSWPLQSRRESYVVGAVGKRHVDAVRSHLLPILESEQAKEAGKVIASASDLPDDFFPKGDSGQ